jgi:hypothetical protein
VKRFVDVTAVASAEPGRFDAVVDAEWTIGGKPNGGYLLAIIGRACSSMSAHDHVIAASAHYVRSPSPGEVSVEAEVLRGGRSASQIRARMTQGGEACVEAVLTMSHLEEATVPIWDRGLPGPGAMGYEQCVALQPVLPTGTRVAILRHVEVRLEPATAGFMTGEPAGLGELRGWVALPGGGRL